MAAQELPVKPPSNQKIKRTNQLQFLGKLLEEMIKKDCATEFFSIPHNESVKNPMDLKTVQMRLKYHFYVRGRDCIKDVHLIFSNACKHYYPESVQVQNAKALENFFYAKLDDMPKPECDLPKSDKNSKTTEVRKKHKKVSPNRRKNDKKITYCSSKLKQKSKIMERERDFQKKIPSKFQKEFQATVQEIVADLRKLYRPLDYVDNLKLYDSLLKVKFLNENFQKYLAMKTKNEGAEKMINKSPGTSTIKKPKEKIDLLPSTSVGVGVESLPSARKIVQVKSKNSMTLSHKAQSNKEKININSKPESNSILPKDNIVNNEKEEVDKNVEESAKNEEIPEKADTKPKSKPVLPSVNMVKPEKEKVNVNPESKPKIIIPDLKIAKSQPERKHTPSPLEILLRSERFCPKPAVPVVTEERKRQREIAHRKRKSLAGKLNFGQAADIMRAFEYEHGIYPYGRQNIRWPKNKFAGTCST